MGTSGQWKASQKAYNSSVSEEQLEMKNWDRMLVSIAIDAAKEIKGLTWQAASAALIGRHQPSRTTRILISADNRKCSS